MNGKHNKGQTPDEDPRAEKKSSSEERSGDQLAGALIKDAYATVTSTRDTHGDAVENMEHIADAWTWYLRGLGFLDEDERLPGDHAARMMELVKLSRTAVGEVDVDHDRDTAGYSGIAGACVVADGRAEESELTEVQDGK